MNVSFPKQKLNLNLTLFESVNPSGIVFAKIVGIRQHLDSDSNSITSLKHQLWDIVSTMRPAQSACTPSTADV